MKREARSSETISIANDSRIQSPNSRRVNKQVMERRRRARINSCLEQIKDIVLEGLEKDPSQFEKLEKADILEMTVQYLEKHRHKSEKDAPSVLSENSGFSTTSEDSPGIRIPRGGVFTTPTARLPPSSAMVGCAGSCSSTENSPPEGFNFSASDNSHRQPSSPETMLQLCRQTLRLSDIAPVSIGHSSSTPLTMTNTPMGPPRTRTRQVSVNCSPDSISSANIWRPW